MRVKHVGYGVRTSHDLLNLVHGVEIRARCQENPILDNSSQRETIEALYEFFPQPGVATSLTNIIKSMDAVGHGTFTVPSKMEEPIRKFNLIGQ